MRIETALMNFKKINMTKMSHDGCEALGVEPVRRTEPGHSASQDDDVGHRKSSV